MLEIDMRKDLGLPADCVIPCGLFQCNIDADDKKYMEFPLDFISSGVEQVTYIAKTLPVCDTKVTTKEGYIAVSLHEYKESMHSSKCFCNGLPTLRDVAQCLINAISGRLKQALSQLLLAVMTEHDTRVKALNKWPENAMRLGSKYFIIDKKDTLVIPVYLPKDWFSMLILPDGTAVFEAKLEAGLAILDDRTKIECYEVHSD